MHHSLSLVRVSSAPFAFHGCRLWTPRFSFFFRHKPLIWVARVIPAIDGAGAGAIAIAIARQHAPFDYPPRVYNADGIFSTARFALRSTTSPAKRLFVKCPLAQRCASERTRCAWAFPLRTRCVCGESRILGAAYDFLKNSAVPWCPREMHLDRHLVGGIAFVQGATRGTKQPPARDTLCLFFSVH
jgi:hypothetical protein